MPFFKGQEYLFMKSVSNVFDFSCLLTDLDNHMKHYIKTIDDVLTDNVDLNNDGVVNEFDYETYLNAQYEQKVINGHH